MGKEEQTRVGSDDEREDSAIARSGAGGAEAEVERSNGPAFYEYWNQMDMLSWMGARITDSADGHATVYFEPGEHHRG
ncbi:MAG: hypothetical protein ACXWQZ_12390, partial [Ktedonobacterales bacterium]